MLGAACVLQMDISTQATALNLTVASGEHITLPSPDSLRQDCDACCTPIASGHAGRAPAQVQMQRMPAFGGAHLAAV